MRIASFNMRGGGSAGHWAAIRDVAQPDLLFVQETRDPHTFPLELSGDPIPRTTLWRSVDHGRWGSALFSGAVEVSPVDVPGFDGWVVGGLLHLADPIYAFSVHLPPHRRSYVSAANDLLDRIAPLVDGRRLILAGDWNLTVGVRHPDEQMKNRPGELELLQRLADEFALCSAWPELHPDLSLPQTLRWARDPGPPYHCDGIFLPRPWLGRLRSADVLSGEPWVGLSDHNPVVAEVAPIIL